MTEPRSLWEDLKQRRVVRAVAIYAVVGWGAFEVTESVTPILGFPELVPRIVLFLLLLGFPLVAGLAWAFDVRVGASADPEVERGKVWGQPTIGFPSDQMPTTISPMETAPKTA